jgi:hypothetical protein
MEIFFGRCQPMVLQLMMKYPISIYCQAVHLQRILVIYDHLFLTKIDISGTEVFAKEIITNSSNGESGLLSYDISVIF